MWYVTDVHVLLTFLEVEVKESAFKLVKSLH